MAELDDHIRKLFQDVPEKFDFEISFEHEGRGLDLDGLAFVMRHLWWCREYATAVAAYAKYILGTPDADEEPDPAMVQFVAVLAGRNTTEIDAALQALVHARIDAARRLRRPPFNREWLPSFAASDPRALQFEFVAGFHENPTRLSFLVVGAVVPVTILVMVVGMSGLYRQHGEPACIQLARETTDRRIEVLTKMHRLEGHMSLPLRENLDSIIRAGDAAERSCRSLLDRFHYKVTMPWGFTFEVALGESPPASPAPHGR